MMDSTGFAELTTKSPVAFHLVWDASDERLDSILENGLIRDETHYDGLWRSRLGHVYMGSLHKVKQIFGNCNDPTKPMRPFDLLTVDVTQLDPRKIDPDEDYFMTGDFPETSGNKINGKHVCQVFRRPFPPTVWQTEWTKYLKWDVLPSLGEWADQVGLGENPAETRYSATRGSISYNGTVPPTALRLVKTTREVEMA
jgi:hypothetical protein